MDHLKIIYRNEHIKLGSVDSIPLLSQPVIPHIFNCTDCTVSCELRRKLEYFHPCLHTHIHTSAEASYAVGCTGRACEQVHVAAKQTASGQDVVGTESRKRVWRGSRKEMWQWLLPWVLGRRQWTGGKWLELEETRMVWC